MFELDDEYTESDIPTTLIRSKADCPNMEVRLATLAVVMCMCDVCACVMCDVCACVMCDVCMCDVCMCVVYMCDVCGIYILCIFVCLFCV